MQTLRRVLTRCVRQNSRPSAHFDAERGGNLAPQVIVNFPGAVPGATQNKLNSRRLNVRVAGCVFPAPVQAGSPSGDGIAPIRSRHVTNAAEASAPAASTPAHQTRPPVYHGLMTTSACSASMASLTFSCGTSER